MEAQTAEPGEGTLSIRERLLRQRAAYETSWHAELELAQARCPHMVVAHYDGHGGLSPVHPVRVCMDCGREEEGGWWCYSLNCPHWHEKDNYSQAQAALGPREGRVFTPKDYGEICEIRVRR